MSDHEIERVLVYYNLTPAQTYQEREFASQRLKIAVEALESIDKYWDISNPESVAPRILEGEKYPNDSMAAGSIINAKQALEQIKKGDI